MESKKIMWSHRKSPKPLLLSSHQNPTFGTQKPISAVEKVGPDAMKLLSKYQDDTTVQSPGKQTFLAAGSWFGIFPSWGLSQKLSRIIGPNKAREVSLTAIPLTAEKAEKWGLVNHVVEGSELLKKAREVAEAIMKNNRDLVLKYKAVINDGHKLDLHGALLLEKERAHDYYNGMTKEQFKKMQEFIAGRSSKKPAAASKL